jgi:16S rRNA (uracil1498-N3)-methyltransferase
MALYDFSAPRLHVDAPLGPGARLSLERGPANYLLNVLRLKPGGDVLVFNGRDGEWRAEIEGEGRKSAALTAVEQTRPQTAPGELLYLFAPLKSARLDYMAQKAVEMGASALKPVFTRRTQASRTNLDRLRANAIEAAEQCGVLSVPEVHPARDFGAAIAELEAGRLLVFCDEDAPLADPVEALRAAPAGDAGIAVLVGPEGGFADEERALLAGRPNTVRVSLGPRILRADTAAVAVLALVQAVLGDWR